MKQIHTALEHKAHHSGPSVTIVGEKAVSSVVTRLAHLYQASTSAGTESAQYWADITVNSSSRFAPLAAIPGVFSALWLPNTAPQTAETLATAGFVFARIPAQLIHFTTEAGALGIAESGAINAARTFPLIGGLFGPGVYMARIGPPLNIFIQSVARVPIYVATTPGTARIVPYLVYVRWGVEPLKLP